MIVGILELVGHRRGTKGRRRHTVTQSDSGHLEEL